MKATIESMPVPRLDAPSVWILRGTRPQVIALIYSEYSYWRIKATYVHLAGGTGKYQRWKVRVEVGDRK